MPSSVTRGDRVVIEQGGIAAMCGRLGAAVATVVLVLGVSACGSGRQPDAADSGPTGPPPPREAGSAQPRPPATPTATPPGGAVPEASEDSSASAAVSEDSDIAGEWSEPAGLAVDTLDIAIRRQVYDAKGVTVSVGALRFADAEEYCTTSFRPLECTGLDDARTLLQISFHVENSSDRAIVFTPQLGTIRIGGERAESLQVSNDGLLVDYPPGAEARGVGVWALRMPHLDAFGADRLRLVSDAPYVSDRGNFTDVGPELDVKLTW